MNESLRSNVIIGLLIVILAVSFISLFSNRLQGLKSDAAFGEFPWQTQADPVPKSDSSTTQNFAQSMAEAGVPFQLTLGNSSIEFINPTPNSTVRSVVISYTNAGSGANNAGTKINPIPGNSPIPANRVTAHLIYNMVDGSTQTRSFDLTTNTATLGTGRAFVGTDEYSKMYAIKLVKFLGDNKTPAEFLITKTF